MTIIVTCVFLFLLSIGAVMNIFKIDNIYNHIVFATNIKTTGQPSTEILNKSNTKENSNLSVYNMIIDKDNEKKEYKVGFVRPVFTYAAYQNNSFYTFYTKYNKYNEMDPHTNITTDLDLLTDRQIPEGPFFDYHAIRGDSPNQSKYFPYLDFFTTLEKHVGEIIPNAKIDNITDVDVHHGLIFKSANQNDNNAYDVLFLSHNEYVTQQEYDNLKGFVANGGTLVFTDSNTLYAEIKYNEDKNSITLAKGHDWRFNGRSAVNSVHERWLNESREWVGSNFLFGRATYGRLHFLNQPFNFTHIEEQYVTNHNANILHNYGVFDPYDNKFNVTTALYEMNFQKGKVISTGIFTHSLMGKPGFEPFLEIFDYLILPHALASQSHKFTNGYKNISIYTIMKTGKVTSIEVDDRNYVLSLYLNRSSSEKQVDEGAGTDNLIITIPRSMMNLKDNGPYHSINEKYPVVTANGNQLDFKSIALDHETGFWIKLPSSNVTKVQIKYILPEFTFGAPSNIEAEAKEEYNILELGNPTIHCNGEFGSHTRNQHYYESCKDITIQNDAPKSFLLGTTYITWAAIDPLSGTSIRNVQNVTVSDHTVPTVTFTSPANQAQVVAGNVVVSGTAENNTPSGIRLVEVKVDNNDYVAATPQSPGNWSNWSITMNITTPGPHTLGARITENTGNVSWNGYKWILNIVPIFIEGEIK
jgi:N,N-dimethylformamidase beta subunit-like protein/Big-like domain-containing protein